MIKISYPGCTGCCSWGLKPLPTQHQLVQITKTNENNQATGICGPEMDPTCAQRCTRMLAALCVCDVKA